MNKYGQTLRQAGVSVPDLPNKLFFSIREVSEICEVEPHVLRYWETEFHHIKPVKKSGNRRFYRQKDVHVILQIKHLLYNLNFTIKGAKKRLMRNGFSNISEPKNVKNVLSSIREELDSVIKLLDD